MDTHITRDDGDSKNNEELFSEIPAYEAMTEAHHFSLCSFLSKWSPRTPSLHMDSSSLVTMRGYHERMVPYVQSVSLRASFPSRSYGRWDDRLSSRDKTKSGIRYFGNKFFHSTDRVSLEDTSCRRLGLLMATWTISLSSRSTIGRRSIGDASVYSIYREVYR